MDRTLAIKKVKAYIKNPELIKEPSMGEMADLVVLVLSAVQQIETSIKEHRLDGKTPVKDVEYLGKESALKLITKGLNDALERIDTALVGKEAEIDAQVQASLERLRDGKDGIVTEEEVQRAAEIALGMLELPDFDLLVTTHLTSNGNAIRDALELLTGEDRYKVEIADVQGLAQALNDLAQIRSAQGGTIGKQQVYNFIRQAIADGTITTGGISDGDKGDITVSGSGTVWGLNPDTVGATELDTTGTPNGSKFLRDDMQWTAIPGGGDMLVATYDPQAIGGDAFDVDNHTDGTTNKVFTATEKTKLGGIEANADVTDAGNVGAVNAAAASKATPVNADSFPIVDSEASNVIKRLTFTNLKAFMKTYWDTLYAPVLGTDDNYVTDAEKTKLSNLSGTNTGDQDLSSYQLKPSEGAFVNGDKTKLDGIETGADVTDTTNVTAAGALMDSEIADLAAVKAINQSLASGASPTFGTGNMTDASNKRFMTDAQETKLDSVESNADVTDAVNVGAVNEAAASKATPIDADSFPITDSAASNVIKKVTFTNLKAFLKTYFDTLYQAVGSYITASSTDTLTNKRIQPRTASSTTASNLSPDLSVANVYYRTTQTATLTIDAPTGTPVIGETIMIYVDSAGAQTLTINSTYKAFGAAFPATTTAGKTFMMSCQFNGTNWKSLWANAV